MDCKSLSNKGNVAHDVATSVSTGDDQFEDYNSSDTKVTKEE